MLRISLLASSVHPGGGTCHAQTAEEHNGKLKKWIVYIQSGFLYMLLIKIAAQ